MIVSIDTSKDSDVDSSKPSSKATSLQNSPAIQKGKKIHGNVDCTCSDGLFYSLLRQKPGDVLFNLWTHLKLLEEMAFNSF